MDIYGKNVIEEVLKKDTKIMKIYLYKGFKDPELLKKIKSKNIPIEWLEKYEMDRKVEGNHQGIIARIPTYHYCELEDFTKSENSLLVLLDHLEDPHNFGAIIRTCEAAGVDGIIIPKDRSVEVNGTVMRVSVGALENIAVAQVTNLVMAIKKLKEEGFWIVGTDMQGTPYDEIDYHGKTAIVIGNEGSGMSRLVKENCDYIATIPMNGTINSLNASVATGIVVFEAVKNRK